MARAIASVRASSRVSMAQAQATAATRHDDIVTVAVRRPGWLDHEAEVGHRTHRITAGWIGLAIARSTGQKLAILRDPPHAGLMLTSIPLTWLISIDDATSQDRAAVEVQRNHRSVSTE